MHVLNSSPTEVHWIAFAGHSFSVIALDGNAVPQPKEGPDAAPLTCRKSVRDRRDERARCVGSRRGEKARSGCGHGNSDRVCGRDRQTRLDTTGRSHLGLPSVRSARPSESKAEDEATRIDLVFDSKFQGHGNEELWRINGKSYPQTDEPILKSWPALPVMMKNLSADDHPMHLHRHTFEVRRVDGSPELQGLKKDVVLVHAKSSAEVEFLADNPGRTLFHCHQQDHMDRGFMMVFRYA